MMALVHSDWTTKLQILKKEPGGNWRVSQELKVGNPTLKKKNEEMPEAQNLIKNDDVTTG